MKFRATLAVLLVSGCVTQPDGRSWSPLSLTGLVPNSAYLFKPTEAQTYHADPPYVEPPKPAPRERTKEERIADENAYLKRVDDSNRQVYELNLRVQKDTAAFARHGCEISGNPNGFACRAYQDFIHTPYDPAAMRLESTMQKCSAFGGMSCDNLGAEVSGYPSRMVLPPLVN